MTKRRSVEPAQASSFFERALGEMAPPADAPTPALWSAWRRAVGPKLARVAEPYMVRDDGTLVVRVATSPWLDEMTYAKPDILDRLRRALGDAAPRDLRFELGPRG